MERGIRDVMSWIQRGVDCLCGFWNYSFWVRCDDLCDEEVEQYVVIVG